MIVAVKGRGAAGGEFEVHEILEPGLAPQRSLTLYPSKGRFVALVSGLNFGSSVSSLFYNLLSEYISGHSGSSSEHNLQAGITRLVIVGNSIITPGEQAMSDITLRFKENERGIISQAVRTCDEFLHRLCSSVPIDIMPGDKDPTNYSMPQQPLDACFLRKSSKFATLQRVSNPYEFTVNNLMFLGHSGQPINNLERYMDVPDRKALVQQMMTWRNIAPSCPDTLSTFPMNEDPFLLEESPHIFFVGNEDKFATSIVKGQKNEMIRIVMIPRFSDSKTIILVDTDSLDIHPITFSSWDD